jgi:hypothetical protein
MEEMDAINSTITSATSLSSEEEDILSAELSKLLLTEETTNIPHLSTTSTERVNVETSSIPSLPSVPITAVEVSQLMSERVIEEETTSQLQELS